VTSLDCLEHFGEPFVVVLDLGRPNDVISVCIVSGMKMSKKEGGRGSEWTFVPWAREV
jgi:hypothetical protein